MGHAFHANLRNGTNALVIEKGRWSGLDVKDRLCLSCNLNTTEDERHFLLHCPRYNTLRNNLFNSILNVSGDKWDFKNRASQEVFILLMEGTGDQYEKIIFRIFHRYLVKCFKIRIQDVDE